MDELVNRAKAFAYSAHSGQVRKGSGLPFTSHLEAVSEYVSNNCDDSELIAAAWLHDVVEDTNASLSDVRAVTNENVANYVSIETEDKMRDLPESDSWKARKLKQINHLNNLSYEDSDVLLIALADKLANTDDMRVEYDKLGDDVWKIFNNEDPLDHKWYYTSFAQIIGNSKFKNTNEYKQLLENIEYIWGE